MKTCLFLKVEEAFMAAVARVVDQMEKREKEEKQKRDARRAAGVSGLPNAQPGIRLDLGKPQKKKKKSGGFC